MPPPTNEEDEHEGHIVIEHRFAAVRQSSNRKTGPIPVVYVDGHSCPTSCPLRRNGCYAESGPVAYTFTDLTLMAEGFGPRRQNRRALTFDELLEWVAALPPDCLWRYAASGDLPGQGDRINGIMLMRLNEHAAHTYGFTYTHKPVLGPTADAAYNKVAIDMVHAANRGRGGRGLTINLSADNEREAEAMLALGIAPVVMLQRRDAPTRGRVGGAAYVTCPAQTVDIDCATCRYCAQLDRDGVVGFRAHGSAAARVEAVIDAG